MSTLANNLSVSIMPPGGNQTRVSTVIPASLVCWTKVRTFEPDAAAGALSAVRASAKRGAPGAGAAPEYRPDVSEASQASSGRCVLPPSGL